MRLLKPGFIIIVTVVTKLNETFDVTAANLT